MKKVLMISQSQDASFVHIIADAVAACGATLTLLSGKFKDVRSGIEIVEMPKYQSETVKSKFLSWFAFHFAVLKWLIKNINAYDLVFMTSNPPVMQTVVLYLRLIKRKKIVYLVWDIYPDIITRMYKNRLVKPIAWGWKWLNRLAYTQCAAVITIGEVMKRVVQAQMGSAVANLSVIPYHADTKFIRPIPKSENWFLQQHGLQSKTVFMYSGKMGLGHSFDNLLDVARQLRSNEQIRFLFIGFGPYYTVIERYIKENELSNVILIPYQPLEVLPYSLSSADFSFITIKKGTEGLFLPSKVYDAMSAGNAIFAITSGENDIKELLKHKVGVNVEPDDVEALKNAILQLAESDCLEYKTNARALAEKYYSVDIITEQYRRLFEKLI